MEKFFELVKNLQKVSQIDLIKTSKKPSKDIQEIHQKVIDLLVEMEIKRNEIQYIEKEQKTIKEIKREVRNGVWVAGGCLSEEFIEGYEKPVQDIDIFISKKLLDTYFYEKEAEYDHWGNKTRFVLAMDLLNNRGKFEEKSKKRMVSDGYGESMMEIDTIIQGSFCDYPHLKVELIVKEKLTFYFDISIREFYYNGGFILATNKALEDIKNKKITLRSMHSPYSALVRSEAFSKRYGFELENHSHNWIKKVIKSRKNFSFQQKDLSEYIKEKIERIEKYTEDFDTEELIKEIEEVELTKSDEELIRKNYVTEDDEYKHSNFVDLVERTKYIKEKGIDLSIPVTIQVPEISLDLVNLTYEETGNPIEKELKRYIKERLNDAKNKKIIENKVKSLFEKNYDIERGVYNSMQLEFYDISDEYGITLTKKDIMTILFLIDLEMYRSGEIQDFTISDVDYFGEKEQILKRLQENQLEIKMSLFNYIYRDGEKNNENEFEIKAKQVENYQKIQFLKKERKLQYPMREFLFLEGERAEFLKEKIFPLADDVSDFKRFDFTAVQLIEANKLTDKDFLFEEILTEEEHKMIEKNTRKTNSLFMF